jgi:hypothetical protein
VTERFIGAGWAFPLRTTPASGFALVTGDREIIEAIQLILSTAPGERPMRPEFGCGVHDFVFDSIDASTVGRMELAIRDALDRWEPRVFVETVEFNLDYVGEGRLIIDIGYRVRATNTMRNLVYPFYVIPAEELE